MPLVDTIINFVKKQLLDIRKGGRETFRKKFRSLSTWVIGGILAIPPLIVVRLLRPVVVIRFGELISHRIGPYVAEPEVYLSELGSGMHQGKFIDVFFHQPVICNWQLKIMWDRALRVIQPCRYVSKLNDLIPGGKIHQVPWRSYQQRDIYGTYSRSESHLQFTESERLLGESNLLKLGIQEGASYVCFHARDSAYGESISKGIDIGRVDYRNSEIGNYMLAIQLMTELGHYALRMGSVVSEALPDLDNDKIIDYATVGRTDFMDIYLSANCEFFIGSTVGITNIPMAFRRPVVHTNFIPIGVIPALQPHDIFIPKKFWIEKEQRYLTIAEIMESGFAMLTRSWQYTDAGISLEENTPCEILAVVSEMNDRTNGFWIEDEEAQKLESKFWSRFDSNEIDLAPQARIGSEFIKRNSWLVH